MSFANFNLLPLALGTLIPPTPFQYRLCKGTETDDFGQLRTEYTDWAEAYGIVQPAGEQNEHVEGIDLAKKRVSVWIKGVDLKATHDQNSSDQIRFLGEVYNVIRSDAWGPYDDFYHVECTSVKNIAGTGGGDE